MVVGLGPNKNLGQLLTFLTVQPIWASISFSKRKERSSASGIELGPTFKMSDVRFGGVQVDSRLPLVVPNLEDRPTHSCYACPQASHRSGGPPPAHARATRLKEGYGGFPKLGVPFWGSL